MKNKAEIKGRKKMKNSMPTRKKILLAALPVFAKKGYEKARMKDIAVEAGVGKSTIYEYFKSKEELFRELVDFLFRDLEEYTLSLLRPEEPPEKKICNVITSFAEYMTNMPYGTVSETMAIILDIYDQSIRTRMVDLRPIYQRESEALVQIIQEGIQNNKINTNIPPESIASMIIAFLDGLLIQWLLFPDQVDINERVKEFCSLLRKGLS